MPPMPIMLSGSPHSFMISMPLCVENIWRSRLIQHAPSPMAWAPRSRFSIMAEPSSTALGLSLGAKTSTIVGAP